MDGRHLIRRVDGLPFQAVEGKMLVVVPRAKAIHLLNETASRIWELLENGDTLDHLIASMCREYDVSPDEARRDVQATLDEMRRKELIA